MTTIGFASWKGGTGKTLLAFNTAERATAAGIKTVLCDFDPQPTCLRQCQLRATHSPNAPKLNAVKGSLFGDGITALQEMARTGDQELLVCDMPGADSFTMDHALGILDLILIPITAAPYEIMITANLVHRGVQNGWNMALVPNNLPSIKTRRQQLLITLTGMGIPIAPASLIRRVTHWDAILAGLGVCEFAPNSPAAAEMQVLWDWLAKQISHIENQQPKLHEEIPHA